MENEIKFDYELCTQDGIRDHIRSCEGNHVQQAVYSTFMDTLTQICYTERKIRGSVGWEANRSWKIK